MEGGSNAGFEAAEASSLNEVNENDFRCISSQLLCICSVSHGAQGQMTNESNLNTQLRTRRKLDRRTTRRKDAGTRSLKLGLRLMYSTKNT